MAKGEVGGSTGRPHQRSDSPAKDGPFRRFLKIILPDTIEEKKLRIPGKFVSRYGDELSDVANLIVSNSHCAWRVGLTRSMNNIWLDENWHEFVEHYSIHPGYSLVFRYRGYSHFNVLIFDMTFCEIRYPSNDQISGKGHNFGQDHEGENEEEDDDDDCNYTGKLNSKIPSSKSSSLKSRVVNDSRSKGEPGKRPSATSEQDLAMNKRHKNANFDDTPSLKYIYETRSKKNVMEEQVKKTDCGDANGSKTQKFDELGMPSEHKPLARTISDDRKLETKFGENQSLPQCEKDLEVITGEMFVSGLKNAPQRSDGAIHAARMLKPKHPSFMVILHRYNFYNKLLYVSADFASRHLKQVHQHIKLQVSDGRQWTIRVIWKEHGALSMGKGWSEFTRENSLKEGDVCVFELVKSNVMEVSIFPAV